MSSSAVRGTLTTPCIMKVDSVTFGLLSDIKSVQYYVLQCNKHSVDQKLICWQKYWCFREKNFFFHKTHAYTHQKNLLVQWKWNQCVSSAEDRNFKINIQLKEDVQTFYTFWSPRRLSALRPLDAEKIWTWQKKIFSKKHFTFQNKTKETGRSILPYLNGQLSAESYQIKAKKKLSL